MACDGADEHALRVRSLATLQGAPCSRNESRICACGKVDDVMRCGAGCHAQHAHNLATLQEVLAARYKRCLFASKEETNNDEVPFDGSRRRDSYGVRGAFSAEAGKTGRLGERRQASVTNYVMKLMERPSGQEGICCWYFRTTGRGEPEHLHRKGMHKRKVANFGGLGGATISDGD